MQMTRESIFVSSIRAFFTGFAVLLGLFAAIAIGCILLNVSTPSSILPLKSDVKLEPDANWSRKALPQTSPAILRINIHGIIGDGALNGTSIKNILLDSRDDPFENNRIKGI